MILPHHLDYLQARGVTGSVALTAGLQSITDSAVLQDYSPSQARHVPGLLVPLYDIYGDACGSQFRPDKPRERDGRPVKFETPPAQANRLTFPSVALQSAEDKSCPLLVIEGPIKALSVWHNLHLAAATLTGVWSWVGRKPGASSATIVPDWRELDLAERDVWIAFDSDIASNLGVRGAAQHLARYLSDARKANVSFLMLPGADSKEGLDDYLAQGASLADVTAHLVTELPADAGRTRHERRDQVNEKYGIPVSDRQRALDWWSVRGQYEIRRDTRTRGWYRYDGRRWESYGSQTTGLEQSVTSYLSGVADDAREFMATAKGQEAATLRELVASLESSFGNRNVVTWAQRTEHVNVPDDYFDPRESNYLWNASNGTIDLLTGDFKEHDSHDRLTGLSPTVYNPAAKATDWRAFLNEILPDREVQKYVQRVLGMSMMADPGIQGAWVFSGRGANGKGMLVRIVSAICGRDYATTIPGSTIQATRREEHPTSYMEFRNRRLALLDEFPKGGGFNEEAFKRLTGGTDITARSMRNDYVSFRPTHTLVITTNYLPEVTPEPAMWRRLHRVPFEVVIPPELRDETRETRIIQHEASGVLNWLLEGWDDFRALSNGGPGRLEEPQSVLDATEEWRLQEDHFAAWMNEALAVDADSAVLTKTGFELYRGWAQDQQVPVTSRLNGNTFTQELVRRDLEVLRDGWRDGVKGTWLVGYKVITTNVHQLHPVTQIF